MAGIERIGSERLNTASRSVRYCRFATKWTPIALNVGKTGYAGWKDCKHKTTRNTVETLSGIAGGYGGGYAGTAGGAAIGTIICPGLGTIVGGYIGGFVVGYAASTAAKKLTSTLSDTAGYDIIEKTCNNCERRFFIRYYRGEQNVSLCQKCS